MTLRIAGWCLFCPCRAVQQSGLPVHVLQRYAGHATPTMSTHYIAERQEHAEQAFLATVKLKADGTRVSFSREDHDSLHLFDRADRFLPHGWCLLSPLQTCDKGNACLTCSVFVTDQTHQDALARQLADTQAAEQAIRALIKRGEPITFQAVQREAGVSHAFLYGHPDLRGRIENLRARAQPAQAQPTATTDNTVIMALTSQITQLKK
jgi:hypothetical protein